MLSSKENGRNLPKYVPRAVWFEVEEEGIGRNRGEESRQLLLEKVQSLENELSWLRMRMKMLEGEDEKDKDGDPRHLVFELGSVPGCSTLMTQQSVQFMAYVPCLLIHRPTSSASNPDPKPKP